MSRGDILLGRFAVHECVGRGGAGTVYRGEHLRTQQHVTIKVSTRAASRKAAAIARMHVEARVVAALRSDHVVTIHDFDIDPVHGPVLVMSISKARVSRQR